MCLLCVSDVVDRLYVVFFSLFLWTMLRRIDECFVGLQLNAVSNAVVNPHTVDCLPTPLL